MAEGYSRSVGASGVKAKLGELGTLLHELNENAFLPNVRDSVVSASQPTRHRQHHSAPALW